MYGKIPTKKRRTGQKDYGTTSSNFVQGDSTRHITDPVEKLMSDSPKDIGLNSGARSVDQLFLGKLVTDEEGGVTFQTVIDLQGSAFRFTHFVLYQSIYDPCMKLNVYVQDSARLTERIGPNGLNGEEFIKFKLNSPLRHDNQSIDLLFHVRNVSPFKTDHARTTSGFMLECATKEKIISDSININKYFNKTESDVAQTIFDKELIGSGNYKYFKGAGSDIWKERHVNVDESFGVDDIIIPGLTPLESLTRMARLSWGGPLYKGSFYTFFETPEGFQFANIEKRIEQNKRIGANFVIDPFAHAKKSRSIHNYRTVQRYSSLHVKPGSKKINNGTFGHAVRTVDYIKKKHNDTTFLLDETYNQFTHTGNISNFSTAFFELFGKKNLHQYTIPIDSTAPESNADQIIGQRHVFKDLMTTAQISIIVYGDVTIKAGDCVGLTMPETGTQAYRDKSIYSGTWFVIGVEHSVDQQKMNTKLHLSKSGITNKHDDIPIEG